MGQMIEHGYMALPPEGAGDAIIILQEYWGLTLHIKDVVDRFAEKGFVCLAPNLYHEKATGHPDEAMRRMMQLNIENTAKELIEIISFLKSEKCVLENIYVMGFCMGGQLALYTASLSKDIAGVVNFYGVHPNVKPDWKKITCPVLSLFGKKDTYISEEMVDELKCNLPHQTVVVYEEAGHAFYNDTRAEAYHKESAEDAEKRVLRFLTR